MVARQCLGCMQQYFLLRLPSPRLLWWYSGRPTLGGYKHTTSFTSTTHIILPHPAPGSSGTWTFRGSWTLTNGPSAREALASAVHAAAAAVASDKKQHGGGGEHAGAAASAAAAVGTAQGGAIGTAQWVTAGTKYLFKNNMARPHQDLCVVCDVDTFACGLALGRCGTPC
jgi:hypothetical protein